MNFRWKMAKRVAWASFLVPIFIGCGGTQEEPYFVRPEQVSATAMESPPAIQAPEDTVLALKACVDDRIGKWSESSHAFQYDMTANQHGQVSNVGLRDATLRDSSLEACFKSALESMRVPKEALRLRSSGPVSGGENTYFGIVQAAAAPIALAPIIIPALGVTIIVAISLEIIRNATSGPDCKKVKQECINYCSDTTLPTNNYGWNFQKCKNDCIESRGCPRDS